MEEDDDGHDAPRPWLTIEASNLAVHQLVQCAMHVMAADANDYRLLDALRSLHLSMVAAMTEALGGSTGTGALVRKAAIKAVDALNRGEAPALDERTMAFEELLRVCQTPNVLPWVNEPLTLTDEEAQACASLNEFRGLVEHPKPTSWSLYKGDIGRLLATVAPVVPRLMRAVPHHYEADDFEVAAKAVASIAAKAVFSDQAS